MALPDLVSEVRGREKTLVVEGPPGGDGLATALRSHFSRESVSVAFEAGSDPVTVRLHDGDGDALVELSADAARSVMDASTDDSLRQHLEERTFAARGGAEMLAATREIEDRAWRVGDGTLHAGFQLFSRFEAQADAYRRLASANLDVHVYAAPDVTPPAGPFVTHETDHPDVTSVWFVAFDAADPGQRCAVVGEEREPDSYDGFLTYDPPLVEAVIGELPVQDRSEA